MPSFQQITSRARGLYRRVFQRQEDLHLRAVVDTLKQVALFQHFSRSMLRDLAESMHRRDYKRDEFLYYRDDPGLGFYIVQRGRVRLLTEDEDGTQHELRQVGAHDFFGEETLLGNGDLRRFETAQAVTEAQVLGFFSPNLNAMLKRTPKTGAAVLWALALHLAHRQKSLVERLAEREGDLAALRLVHGEHPTGSAV